MSLGWTRLEWVGLIILEGRGPRYIEEEPIYIYILILLKICLIYIFFHKPRGAGALWDPPESVPV